MRKDKRSRQLLNSDARLSHINVFVPSQLTLENRPDEKVACFSRLKYNDLSLQLSPIEDGVIRDFPFLIRGDGKPWDIGNLYLMGKFTEMAKLSPPVIETIRSIAKQLLMYLRWIEHLRKDGQEIHELYFPVEEEKRVTWAYYRYLKRLLRQKDEQVISLSVAKARMQAVIGFYRGLLKWQLIGESAIQNDPYKSALVGIPIVNHIGLQMMKIVETTNFKIPKPERDKIGVIADGGALRPLTEEEQSLVLEQLKKSGNRAFQLMCFVTLFTGARIQTVCTLRVKDIHNLIKRSPVNSEVHLRVGEGTGVDTKNQKRYRLHIPIQLIKMLRDYIDSEEAQERRALSFYGDSDENYVFLTSNGSPYYTSSSEIIDRQEGKFSKRISARDRVSFSIQTGNALRNYLNRLIRDIQANNPDFNAFRYHDLRATFGMNFIRDADASGTKDIRNELKARMGHSSFNTTQDYLNYDKNNEMVKSASAFHHNRINRISEQFRL